MTNAMDEFDDLFFDEDGGCALRCNDGGGGHEGRATEQGAKGKSSGGRKRGEDDVISIGSSSSSSSDDDDDDVVSSSSSSSYASSSSSDDDDLVSILVKESNRDVSMPAPERGTNDDKLESANCGGADMLYADSDDLGDLDLDDEDTEFFSSTSRIPAKDRGMAKMTQKVQMTHEDDRDDENARVGEQTANDHRFATLDEDALAELEENYSVDERMDAKATRGKEFPARSKMLQDFTISYNCEIKECLAEEELLESSDDDDVGGDRTNKENSSPNKSKPTNSSYFEKNGDSRRNDRHEDVVPVLLDNKTNSSKRSTPSSPSSLDTPRENSSSSNKSKSTNSSYFGMHGNMQRDDRHEDVVPDLFDIETTSSKRSTPGSPSSLDTPHENSSSSSITPPVLVTVKKAVKGKDTTPAAVLINHFAPATTPAVPIKLNPYQTQQRQHRQSEQSTARNDRQERSLENQNVLPKVSNLNSTDPVAKNSARDGTADVVSLPDIGLSPLAQQSELQRLGIDHSHYKPPRYTPNPDPIFHKLSTKNRPLQARRNTAVDKVFTGPVKNLWKSKFKSFNHVQSEMAQVLASSDDNVVVSAPTGAGKTALFEMAMARLFARNMSGRHGMGGSVSKEQKVVYIAPNKALCEERQSDWAKRLVDIDPSIICTTITGDAKTSSSYAEIASANLILTTPEKLDSITRRWNDQFVLLSCIKLVLIDEVHLIGETDRGGCLESVICRMKTIQRAACARKLTSSDIASSSYKYTSPEALMSKMRIVAVSATLPNLGHIASFVESGEAYMFDQSYRPVPLNVYVQACGHIGNNRYLFDKSLKQHVPGILRRFSSGRPSIVFCHSKKETEELADELTKSYANPSGLNESALLNYSSKTDNVSLHQCIRKGIAFHHAGLDPSDRRLVEEAFGSGFISCLAATSTLSMGVNLPSHLVGTSAYRGAGNGHQDIDTSTLLQMMGRAGRPGFDTSGTAVIMTDTLSKTRYENLSQGLKVVESHLMDENKLTEVLNIEISQGVIVSAEEAVDWAKGTFLYQRILSNPLFYGFNGKGDDALHSFMLEKCSTSIDNLRKIRAIAVDEDGAFSPDVGSHVMSRNFIDFETMKAIVKLPHDSGPHKLLTCLSNCAKIQAPIRRNEKKALNEAYKTIKYKLEGPQSKVRIQTDAEKCFVMLQAAIGQYFFSEFALRQQMSYLIDGASQVLSAVEQYATEGSRNGQVAIQSMFFRRSLYSSLWGEHDGVLNQIGGVTQEMAAKLKVSGISTFADAVSSSNEDIVKAIHVTDAFAKSLRVAASTILHRTLKLSARFIEENDDEGPKLDITLQRRVVGSSEKTNERVVSYSLVIFTDRAGGLLHFSDKISSPATLCLCIPEKKLFGRIYIRLLSNLVGLDEQVHVEGLGEVQKSAFSLSPTVAKGKKNQSQLSLPPSTSGQKRPFDTHRNSVSNVSDLRLHKRGNRQEERDNDCIIIDSEAVEYDVSKSSSVAKERSCSKKVVTPSPHPHTKSQNAKKSVSACDTTSSSVSRSDKIACSRPQNLSGRETNTPSWSNNMRSIRKGPRNNRSSWFQEKSNQKTSQQIAFNSPKENPFSSYSFDPNNIENSLVSNADKSKHHVQQQSIIPNNASNSIYSIEKPRFQAFHTPANVKRRTAASNQISSVGLLQQKAAELQQFHSVRRPMHHNMMEAAVHNHTVYPANDGCEMNQHDERIHGPDHFLDPVMMTQRALFHEHMGASTGSMMQQSVGIAQEYSRTPPPPPFIGRNTASSIAPIRGSYFHRQWGAPTVSVMQQSFGMEQSSHTLPPFMGHSNPSTIAQNNTYTRGAMSGVTRPVSSSGLSIASRLRENRTVACMPPQYQYPTQSLRGSQSQFDHQLHVQRREDFIPGFQHGMSQSHFEDTFNDPVCLGLDPTYGNTMGRCYGMPSGNMSDGMSTYDHPFGGDIVGVNTDMYHHDDSFGNMSRDVTQFEGGHSIVHNPYQHSVQHLAPRQHTAGRATSNNPYQHSAPQQQTAFPSNPYKKNMHQPQNLHCCDNPPMQEVVVQNSSVRSGLGGDDTSQFDDAFL